MHVFPAIYGLTHWGRVTHICVGKLIIICSDNGLSPDRRQAIIWTNAELLSIGPLPTYFSENLIKMQQFSLKKMHVKMLSAKWRLSCLGLNVLVRKLFSIRTSDFLAALLCFHIPVNILRPEQRGSTFYREHFKMHFSDRKMAYLDLNFTYRQFSNIRRSQSKNINVSRLALLLALPNPSKPCVKLRMKM